VKVGDGVWSARGPDAEEGTPVRITGADGSCLRVEPLAVQNLPGTASTAD
jgi:membrane protein implicated in regulation of membrane protease activity